ncbi:hypothetical protein RMN57_35520 [Kitasatospora sp. CM 4170]|uniref:Uncharacterized protein n=1 Tax=Kitasatospora aburaviensis TaxID=67265 RepID=A0ABW1EYX3_9ACTN|nr:hypothetical protein [Kitasatospora sp. CM 4170]WNM49633.1 hypothetical protein RMN57_35520 [Kitasatospora sp. CM 4170]
MRVELTRDSVAMGDDVWAPHAEAREVPDDASVKDVLDAVRGGGYLASIAGGRATWIAETADGTALAVVAQQWPTARLLAAGEGPIAGLADGEGVVRLHFVYRVQTDPEAEHRRLAADPGGRRAR